MLIVQGDNGVVVQFFARKSSSLDLTDATVNVNITKSDGSVINKPVTIIDPTSGRCSFTLYSNDLLVSGLYKYQWTASYPDGRNLSGMMAYFYVSPSGLQGIPAANGSGNIADYISWAFSGGGVSKASVFPLNRGPGTVDIVVATSTGIPTADLIFQVQTAINNNKPVDVDALVLAPTEVPINITAHISVQLGYEIAGVTSDIQQAITDYINSVPIGGIVYSSQMVAAVLAVSGLTDCSVNLTVNGIAYTNFTLTPMQLAQVGTMTVGT